MRHAEQNIASLLVMLWWTPVVAQELTQGGGDPSALVLRLVPERQAVTLYEPLVLRYLVTNPTEMTIKSEFHIKPYSGDPHFRIQKVGEKERSYFSGPIAEYLSVEGTISPGEVLEGDIEIYFNDLDDALAFPTPGIYSVRAETSAAHLKDRIIILESNHVDVRVSAPGDVDQRFIAAVGSEAKLVKLLRGGVAHYCSGEGKAGVECVQTFRTIVTNLAGSAYAPHVAYLLAVQVADGGIRIPTQRTMTIDLLSDFLQRWSEHSRAPDVLAMLAGESELAGKHDKALDLVAEFEKKYPDHRRQIVALRKSIH